MVGLAPGLRIKATCIRAGFQAAAVLVFLSLLVPLPGRAAAGETIHMTDIMNRDVVLQAPARRLVLGAGRHVLAIALIHPDPVSLVVGWRDDFTRDPATFSDWSERFPAIGAIPVVGGAAGAGLDVEAITNLKPDLVVLSLYDAEAPGTVRSIAILEKLGIPVLVIDFFSHPLSNSLPSLRMLGRALGVEPAAERFATFYDDRLERVRGRIAERDDLFRPRLFMHVHAGGMPCCSTAGSGVFGEMIELAGGHNAGAERIAGLYGDITLEQLIVDDPTLYVATGGAHLARGGGLVLGPGTSEAQARESFARLLSTPGLDQLTAVRKNHAFAIWHMFNDTPAHIVMIEWLASILHPELFSDIDPAETLVRLNEDFLAVPMSGTFWLNP